MNPGPLTEMREEELSRLRRASHTFRATGNRRFGETVNRQPNEGIGLQFRELRPYTPGDDIRHVDWRVTQRRDNPHVRTFEDEQSSKWHVCLDCSASMGRPDPRRWKLAVQSAAAFAYLLLGAGNRVGLLAFNNAILDCYPPGPGRTQYARISGRLNELGTGEPFGGSNLAAIVPYLQTNSHVVLISDFLQPDAMITALRAMQHRGRKIHAICISSAADAQDTGPGRADLVDVETGGRLAISPGAHEVARTQLAALAGHLKNYCNSTGIRLSSTTTTTPWLTTVLRHGGIPVG